MPSARDRCATARHAVHRDEHGVNASGRATPRTPSRASHASWVRNVGGRPARSNRATSEPGQVASASAERRRLAVTSLGCRGGVSIRRDARHGVREGPGSCDQRSARAGLRSQRRFAASLRTVHHPSWSRLDAASWGVRARRFRGVRLGRVSGSLAELACAALQISGRSSCVHGRGLAEGMPTRAARTPRLPKFPTERDPASSSPAAAPGCSPSIRAGRTGRWSCAAGHPVVALTEAVGSLGSMLTRPDEVEVCRRRAPHSRAASVPAALGAHDRRCSTSPSRAATCS
jgi:hypothetical protein